MIAVVDEHRIFREGVVSALCAAGHDAISVDVDAFDVWLVAQQRCEAAVIALRGLDLDDGLASAAAVRPVVAVVDERTTAGFRSALRAGASAVISRLDDTAQLVRVVEAALRGDTLLPAGIARDLASQSRRADVAPELEEADVVILHRLASGSTVSAIARELHRSERDCYRMIAQLCDRLRVRNRSQAIARAASLGLLPDIDPQLRPEDGKRSVAPTGQ